MCLDKKAINAAPRGQPNCFKRLNSGGPTMRYLSVPCLLLLLLFSQSAEAARISFATENCGTPAASRTGVRKSTRPEFAVLLNTVERIAPCQPIQVAMPRVPSSTRRHNGALRHADQISISAFIDSDGALDRRFRGGTSLDESRIFRLTLHSDRSAAIVLNITFTPRLPLASLAPPAGRRGRATAVILPNPDLDPYRSELRADARLSSRACDLSRHRR